MTIYSSLAGLGSSSGSEGFTWVDATSGTQTLAVGTGYVTDNAGGVTYTLPSTAILGNMIKIVGKSGIATITPNANQQILIGSVSGTVGARISGWNNGSPKNTYNNYFTYFRIG